MSVASVAEEQELQCDQPGQNGASDATRTGSSPSAVQAASPVKNAEMSFGPSNDILSQPSSPPHNYRHSRAYRHFKNPPQPHMCIRVTTVAGEEVFINVLSWMRIVVPQEPTDPIPLYGGMKVQPGSPRCPPLVYAVMANPEVLKDSGRHSKDPEERRAMVELMCDFVEAMNPDLRLNRNAVILKDRDISGELKDVWNAVQAQRDREREEQMIQQHTHVPPPQQLFPPQRQDPLQFDQQSLSAPRNFAQNQTTADNKIVSMEFGPEMSSSQTSTNLTSKHSDDQHFVENGNLPDSGAQSAITSKNASNLKHSMNEAEMCSEELNNRCDHDQTDSSKSAKTGAKDPQATNDTARTNGTSSKISPSNESQSVARTANSAEVAAPSTSTPNKSKAATSPITPTPTLSSSSIALATAVATLSTTATTNATTTTTTSKKEKLSGFLPNSCIFPRFKNKNKDKNKEKDKDKDKEKEKEKSSSHHSAKEKNLLNSFKKTTTAATNAFTKSLTHNEDSSAMKNCLNLEAEVEKLDLNKIDAPHANEVLIKVATPAAK